MIQITFFILKLFSLVIINKFFNKKCINIFICSEFPSLLLPHHLLQFEIKKLLKLPYLLV